MKLWLITQGTHSGYDTYDSAVVAAEDEKSARETFPAVGGDFIYSYHDESWWYIWPRYMDKEKPDSGSLWADNADQVNATYLGEAAEGTEAGPICASFNAG